jgi:hypothetical protein
MWWRASFGQSYWVDRVRIRNRRDCCGGRLAGAEVLIGGTKCGSVEPGTKNGQWYTVRCQTDIRGDRIEIRTTRNEYLSISGIEVWSGEDEGDDDEVESTVGGGAWGNYNVPANTKCGINQGTANQSTNYNKQNSYPASNAFAGNKFSHTQKGVGQWWEV